MDPTPSRRSCVPALLPPARLAAVLLLLVWVGPVSFDQTGAWMVLRWLGTPEPAAAESQLIPANLAMFLEPGRNVTLHMKDGRAIRGRFLRRTLLDSTTYAPRFEAYAHASSYVPLAWGESLHVALRDGREMTAPFVGYAELSLLLRSPVDSAHASTTDAKKSKRSRHAVGPVRVPFESAITIERTTGERVDPIALSRAFRDGVLPSAEALAIGRPVSTGRLGGGGPGDTGTAVLEAPVEDIQAATAELSEDGSAAGIIVLGIIAAIVLIAVTTDRPKQKGPTCDANPPYGYGAMSVRVTDRPFDRQRGCFVGDGPAVADAWPAPTEGGPAVAMAGPDTTP